MRADVYSATLLLASTASASNAADEYYSGIKMDAVDAELKASLQVLVANRTTLSYNQVWEAFAAVDVNLPGYPCDSNDLSKSKCLD